MKTLLTILVCSLPLLAADISIKTTTDQDAILQKSVDSINAKAEPKDQVKLEDYAAKLLADLLDQSLKPAPVSVKPPVVIIVSGGKKFSPPVGPPPMPKDIPIEAPIP